VTGEGKGRGLTINVAKNNTTGETDISIVYIRIIIIKENQESSRV
jgi:hypothetical protein